MRAQSFLIKPASGGCNMRCRYCFYADVADSRQVPNYGLMQPQTLELIVKNALAEVTEACTFGFQGGEPTLAGLDFYRNLIALEQTHNVHGVRIQHTLQTNGLCLNDEWAAFFAQNNFLVGLSIDGPKEVHDKLRQSPKREGTHAQAMQAARLLQAHGVPFNVLSVITRQLAAQPDKAWQFYRRAGFRFLQFIPCLDGLEQTHGANPYSLKAEAYGRFLCRIFDLWYAEYTQGNYISVRIFDNYIQMLMGNPPENCAMAGRCAAYPLIEADGSVYPCDFYALDAYCLGNVAQASFAQMLAGPAAQAFMAPSHHVNNACRACRYFALCRGGCRRDREPLADGMPRLNHYCKAYQMLFAHALPRMTQIARMLQAGNPAADPGTAPHPTAL